MDEEEQNEELDSQFKVGEYEIEIVDEREPEDQREPVDTETLDAEEEELKDVSAGVQKRIDKLTFKLNEERRQREAAERVREEAVLFAQKQRNDAEQMREILKEGEGVLVAEVRSRTAADVERAKQRLSLAMESGDANAATEAQMALNKAQIEQHQAESYSPVQAPEPPQAHPQAPQQVQQQPQAGVDPLFEAWRAKNTWFDSDAKLQAYAVALDQELREKHGSTSGFIGSEAYYRSIDDTMRSAFPGLIGTEGTSEPAASPAPSVVAPTTRAKTQGGKPRTVQLTESERDLASRLGLTLPEYIREVLEPGSTLSGK